MPDHCVLNLWVWVGDQNPTVPLEAPPLYEGMASDASQVLSPGVWIAQTRSGRPAELTITERGTAMVRVKS